MASTASAVDLRRNGVLLCLVALLVLSLAGCASSTPEVRSQDSNLASVEPTQTEPDDAAIEPADLAAINEGKPIDTIADPVNATRKSLMAAAHEYLGVPADDKFLGWQCIVQGTTAVLDLQPVKGGQRELMAFVDTGDGWKGTYRIKYLDATSGALLDGVPQVTAGLADEVVFMAPVAMDSGYAAAAKTAKSQYGAPNVYAPTRMPEGFRLTKADLAGQGSFEYSDGSRTIIVHPSIYGDWGEGAPPAHEVSGLRMGDLPATLDRDFDSMLSAGGGGKTGPFLIATQRFDSPSFGRTACEIWISSYGATPGMVTAVGESMVKVRP